MSKWTDTELKRLAFDYVRGELSLDDSELIESRMSESQDFAEYVSRLQALLSSAKTSPPESYHPIEPDALFSRITGALNESDVEDEEAQVLELPVRRPWGILIALAALVVLGLAWFLAGSQDATQSQPQPHLVVAEREPVVVPKEERVTDLKLESLHSNESEDAPLRVFASGDAQWKLDDGLDKKLTLEEGILLVEYVPKAGERLSVNGRGFQVQVTGTVFYVSNHNGGVVGVVAGGVRVTPDRGQPVQVKAGQEYLVNEGLRAIQPSTLEGASEHVDVQSHLDRLAQRRLAPAKAEKEEPQKRPARSKLNELRSESQIAMREGRYSDASTLMEQLLKLVPPSDPMAGAVRLDLARVYIQRLNRPEQAAFHLKQFVVARPADAATPSAQEELCRILRESGRRDPLCDH